LLDEKLRRTGQLIPPRLGPPLPTPEDPAAATPSLAGVLCATPIGRPRSEAGPRARSSGLPPLDRGLSSAGGRRHYFGGDPHAVGAAGSTLLLGPRAPTAPDAVKQGPLLVGRTPTAPTTPAPAAPTSRRPRRAPAAPVAPVASACPPLAPVQLVNSDVNKLGAPVQTSHWTTAVPGQPATVVAKPPGQKPKSKKRGTLWSIAKLLS